MFGLGFQSKVGPSSRKHTGGTYHLNRSRQSKLSGDGEAAIVLATFLYQRGHARREDPEDAYLMRFNPGSVLGTPRAQ
ncbi:MAG: hypothetical protein IH968_16030 [Gemmatimonadetes bacterium]|nr:hypothetical protein [Gemmatimonadota bacterium]